MPILPLHCRAAALLALAFASLAHAQAPSLGDGPGRGPESQSRADLRFSYSTTAAGTSEFRGRDGKDSGADSLSVSVEGRIALRPPQWTMPLGLESQNLYFDEVPGMPLPASAHTLSLSTGVGYRPGGDWMYMARVRPTLYRTSGIGSGDLGVGVALMALWRENPTRSWMFGVMANPDGEYPVLPIVGVNWAITPDLTLSLMVPRPRLEYRLDPQWSLHVGGSLEGDTFRTSPTFGRERGEPAYNHALANYRDIRVGAGFEVKLTERLLLQADAGYSVNRQLEYRRIDERVKFDPAPFFKVGLTAKF